MKRNGRFVDEGKEAGTDVRRSSYSVILKDAANNGNSTAGQQSLNTERTFKKLDQTERRLPPDGWPSQKPSELKSASTTGGDVRRSKFNWESNLAKSTDGASVLQSVGGVPSQRPSNRASLSSFKDILSAYEKKDASAGRTTSSNFRVPTTTAMTAYDKQRQASIDERLARFELLNNDGKNTAESKPVNKDDRWNTVSKDYVSGRETMAHTAGPVWVSKEGVTRSRESALSGRLGAAERRSETVSKEPTYRLSAQDAIMPIESWNEKSLFQMEVDKGWQNRSLTERNSANGTSEIKGSEYRAKFSRDDFSNSTRVPGCTAFSDLTVHRRDVSNPDASDVHKVQHQKSTDAKNLNPIQLELGGTRYQIKPRRLNEDADGAETHHGDGDMTKDGARTETEHFITSFPPSDKATNITRSEEEDKHVTNNEVHLAYEEKYDKTLVFNNGDEANAFLINPVEEAHPCTDNQAESVDELICFDIDNFSTLQTVSTRSDIPCETCDSLHIATSENSNAERSEMQNGSSSDVFECQHESECSNTGGEPDYERRSDGGASSTTSRERLHPENSTQPNFAAEGSTDDEEDIDEETQEV